MPIRIPGSIRGRATQGVARILAPDVGTDDEPGGIGRGHVLRGVNRDVDAILEQRLLELLDEDATCTDLAERSRAVAVAGGRDRHERNLHPRPAQQLCGTLGLGEGEPTSAGTDAKQHGSGGWRRCPTHRSSDGPAGECERTRSALDRAAVDRPDGVSCLVVLPKTEEIPHNVSIDHAVGRDRRLLHAHGRKVQELVDDLRR